MSWMDRESHHYLDDDDDDDDDRRVQETILLRRRIDQQRALQRQELLPSKDDMVIELSESFIMENARFKSKMQKRHFQMRIQLTDMVDQLKGLRQYLEVDLSGTAQRLDQHHKEFLQFKKRAEKRHKSFMERSDENNAKLSSLQLGLKSLQDQLERVETKQKQQNQQLQQLEKVTSLKFRKVADFIDRLAAEQKSIRTKLSQLRSDIVSLQSNLQRDVHRLDMLVARQVALGKHTGFQ